jgi:predicted metal-dependent phosphoesterase TrpH
MMPAEIIAEAASLGLAGLALTDHDTMEGWDEARNAAQAHGIDFLPGIEITTKTDGLSVHLLAFGVDPNFAELFAELARIQMSRVRRAEEMVNRLSADYDIEWHEVRASIGQGGTVGRPHIADALVNKGHFVDRGDVFDQVLHPGSPYYVRTYAIDTVDAIELVNAAGGAAVLAHPAAVRQHGPAPVDRLTEFYERGLWGVELDHPENRPDWIPPLRARALELGLEITGASDYHGAGKVNRLGERTSSLDLIERLRDRVVTKR